MKYEVIYFSTFPSQILEHFFKAITRNMGVSHILYKIHIDFSYERIEYMRRGGACLQPQHL